MLFLHKIFGLFENTSYLCVKLTQKDMAKNFTDKLHWKIFLMAALSLLLLIPLTLIREQIRERQQNADESLGEVSGSWGWPQTLSGP